MDRRPTFENGTPTMATTNPLRQKLQSQREQLAVDIKAARACLKTTHQNAEPLIQRRDACIASPTMRSWPMPSPAECKVLQEHSQAAALVDSLESSLRDVERELHRHDDQTRSIAESKALAGRLPELQAAAKLAQDHARKVLALRTLKTAELDKAHVALRTAENKAAVAAVAALLGQDVPEAATDSQADDVERLQCIVNQIAIELQRADQARDAAVAALEAVRQPILMGQLYEAKAQFMAGLEKLMPALDAWAVAGAGLGWNYRVPDDIDMTNLLNVWREAQAA